MALSSHPVSLLQSIAGKYVDLTLGSNVFVHSSLFSKLSPFVSSMLNTVDTNEMVRLVMPQVELVTIQKMVELIYTGRCFVTHPELLRLNNLLNCLDMSMVVDSLSLNTNTQNDQPLPKARNEEKYEFVEESGVKIVSDNMKKTESDSMPLSRLEACDSSLNERSLRSFKKDEVYAKFQHDEIDSKKGKKEKSLNVVRCKICHLPMNLQSRFKVANHMFSKHFKNRFYATLRKNQRECNICRKVFDSSHTLARHLGETHELATTLYDQLTSGGKISFKQHKNISGRKENCNNTNDEKQMKKVHWRRIRSSTYSLPIEDHLSIGVSVSVQNIAANTIEDISLENLGGTHETDTALDVEKVTNEQLKKYRIFISESEQDKYYNSKRRLEEPNITDEYQQRNMSCKRIRSSVYSLPVKDHLRSGVCVKVRNDNIPAIENLSSNLSSSQKPESICNIDISSSQISSKLLVHGRNSIPWKVYDEEYSECEMGWVEKGRRKEIDENTSLISQEKQFFCLWNEFILSNGYIGYLGRIHMSQVVQRFIEEEGKQVKDKKLYMQFVSHLILLEVEAVLNKNQTLKLLNKMNKICM